MICSLREGWPCAGWPCESAMMCLYELCSADEGYTIIQDRRVEILRQHQGVVVRYA